MRILFIHQNFPGQFGHLASALAQRGDEVIALRIENRANLAGIKILQYQPSRSNTQNIPPLLLDTESKIIRGESCFIALQKLYKQGYIPDIIYAHPGWGESLFIKDIWPTVPLINFFEFFYKSRGADFGFDPEFPTNSEDLLRLKTKNLVNLMSLELCDAGISPTEWQKSLQPLAYQSKIHVIHDGINTDIAKPNDEFISLKIPSINQTFTSNDEIVTFINRNLEPYRGYHNFIRSIPEIMRERRNVKIIIVGDDRVGYGTTPKFGTWREQFLNEVKSEIDLNRIHFLGKLNYTDLIKTLQISSAHVYLTYPFVLSWSMLDAMSTGCLVIGSNTPPVTEVLKDSFNGLLVDFFSPNDIAKTVIKVLKNPEKFKSIRHQARKSILENYDLKSICLPKQINLLDMIAKK
jgi:glycosyltransferase involved in cell wall biosynthesis